MPVHAEDYKDKQKQQLKKYAQALYLMYFTEIKLKNLIKLKQNTQPQDSPIQQKLTAEIMKQETELTRLVIEYNTAGQSLLDHFSDDESFKGLQKIVYDYTFASYHKTTFKPMLQKKMADLITNLVENALEVPLQIKSEPGLVL